MNAAARPVVALDLDGVVRRLVRPPSDGEPSEPDPGAAWFDVDLDPAVWVDSPFHTRLREPETIRVLLNVWIGGWVNDLLARGVEVVWATTWEHTANHYFAPLLVIPELPVGVSMQASPPKPTESQRWWKLRSLAAAYPERPLVWIDDQAWVLAGEDKDSARSLRGETARTLVVETDEALGLVPPQARQVDDWLASAAGTPPGRWEAP